MQKLHVVRLLAVLLILAMVFAGCQSNSSSSSQSSSESLSVSGSGPSDSELEAVVLEYYMPEKEQTDAAKVWEEINKYVTEKINATVNIHWIEGAEYSRKMSAIIGAGQEFDLCASPSVYLSFSVNAANGAFVELDDLLTEYAPDLLNELPAYVLEGGKINGKIYGVPSYKDVANVFSIRWNETLREELGVDKELLTSEYSFLQEKYEAALDFKTKRDAAYPETADYPVFKTVHDNLAMWCAYDEIVNYVSTNVGGVEYFAGQGAGEKVFNVFDTPEFVQICKDIRKFVDARLIPQYQENFDEDNALLNTGIIPLRTSQGIVSIKPDIDGDWVAEMNRSKVAISSTGYLQSAITAVSTSSKNPERAVMYMNLQYSDEYIATASRFGIEGVHYNIVQDDNGNDRLDFTGTPNGAEALSDRTYYNWYGAQWGNLFKCILPINQPDDVFEKLQKMNEDAGQYETNLGFVFNQESVVNEIAACAGVIDEFRKPLMAGAYPEDQIEAKCAEFVEKLKANGIQKIVDEAQSQLNEWRAAQGKTTYKG